MTNQDSSTATPEDSNGGLRQRRRRGGLLGLLALPWVRGAVRWGIAVFGIYYVVSNISLNDRVMIASPVDGWPTSVRLAAPADENSTSFTIIDPVSRQQRAVQPDELLAKADPTRVTIRKNGDEVKFDTLARRVLPHDNNRHDWPILVVPPRNLWQKYWDRHAGPIKTIHERDVIWPRDIGGGLAYPLIEQGIGPMVRNADRRFLLAAVMVFPVVFLITGYRWWALLNALEIRMTRARAFKINMVGAFYNTFMPGSTGGDLLKAYYASKLTTHRTRAVMSVIVDRILGLLALIILGGTMATYAYLFALPASDPARRKCGQVALGSALLIFATIAGLVVFYTPLLRRITGMDFVMRRLPMQKQVAKAIETMEIYRRRPGLVLWAILITLPVHAIVVISATFAGMAFGLPLHPVYYWVVVPVVVLAGSIPISPQGAGVMEFFAILLTKRQGCTVSQAFALTMSIRVVQMLWNLTGGYFVLRGGFHVPTDHEQKEMERDEPDEPPSGATARGWTAPPEPA
jgi:uncharacterized protein (TIRG00374 family)